MRVCPTSGDCLSCLIWRVGHTVVESLHDVGLHMKPRNGFTKPLDLALVALLQPPVSNKIPGCFFKTRPSTTRRHDKYCILCVSARPLQREIPVSSHASPNRLHEHMIPSQLLDNEVFLGCKRRVASCILSSIFTSTHSEPESISALATLNQVDWLWLQKGKCVRYSYRGGMA